MIDPYSFVRGVTLGLGVTWTALGILRAVRCAERWRQRLTFLGLDRRWWRRQVALACLRTTVLDPLNLALMCLLIGLWSLRGLT